MAIEYSKFSKIQKVAAFLISVGPECAGEITKRFNTTELEPICREIAAMPMLSASVRREALRELSQVIADGLESSLGGAPFAQAMVHRAKGDQAAQAMLNRCTPAPENAASEEIRHMDSRHLLNVVRAEQPQTVAFILSCLDPAKSAEMVMMLPAEVREDVMERLGGLESVPSDSLAKVVGKLNRQFNLPAGPRSAQGLGGVVACADILKVLDKDLRKSLLARIAERNAPLGAAIRNKIFTFDDLSRLNASDRQRVFREVDSAILPVALKSARPAITAAVLSSMSKRAAQSLKDEIDQLGPQRAKDVEAAQDKIIQIVRKLEDAGDITIEDEGGGDAPA